MGGAPPQFLREKPLGRGWLHKTCFTWGGGGTQQKFTRGSSARTSTPLLFYIPCRNPLHIPKLEHCIPFKCCKFTVFEIWKNHKPTLDFFTAINFFLLAILGLFRDGKTDFPTLLYTSNSETPNLSYTWELKKVPPSVRSLSQGWVPPPGGSAYSSKARNFPNKASFHEPSFLIHLVNCAPSFIIIGIPFCSGKFSVSGIRAWNFGGWIFGPGIFLGFDFCLHSNIPRANYSWSSPSLRSQNTSSGVLPSSLHQSHLSLTLACEQALLFGQAKRVLRERASERRSREGPLARAFSRGLLRSPK